MRTIRAVAMAISLAAISLSVAAAARTDIVLSANDGKQIRAGDIPPGPTRDNVAVLEFGNGKPRLLGSVEVPTTLFGPPASLAVSSDGRFAIVTASQRLGPDNKLQPDGVVSLINLGDLTRPHVVRSMPVGPGAMSVALNASGTLALVSSASDDSVTAFSVSAQRLTEIARLSFEPKAEPRNVVFSPDGKSAYVVRFGDGLISRLAIKGSVVTRAGDIPVGANPNSAVVTPDGRYLLNTNFNGTPFTAEKIGAVSTIDLRSGKMIGAVEVGLVPEHLTLSPDGRFLAVVVGNGSATQRTAPNYDTVLAKLKVFRLAKGRLTLIAETDTGHYCQGAVFGSDGGTILQQCALEKTIETYRFDGTSLTRIDAAIAFEARPGSIAVVPKRRTGSKHD